MCDPVRGGRESDGWEQEKLLYWCCGCELHGTTSDGTNDCETERLDTPVGATTLDEPCVVAPYEVSNGSPNGGASVAFPGWQQSSDCSLGNLLRFGVAWYRHIVDDDGEPGNGRSGAEMLVSAYGTKRG